MGLAEPGRADSVVAYLARDERRGGSGALPENCEWLLRIAAAHGNLQRLRGLCGFPRIAGEAEGCGRGGGVHYRQFARGSFDSGDEKGETRFLSETADA